MPFADDSLPAVCRPPAHSPPLTAVQGLVKNIGVSNCSILKIQQLLKTATIKPAVNQVRLAASRHAGAATPHSIRGLTGAVVWQVEIHPFWRNDKVREYCKEEGIHTSAYCPLGTPYTSAKAVIRRAQSVSSVRSPPPPHTHEWRYPSATLALE